MTRGPLILAGILVLAATAGASAFGNDRADPGYHGQIQQGVYDFHRRNAERQGAPAAAPRAARPARPRR
jgi:hypothetical protein